MKNEVPDRWCRKKFTKFCSVIAGGTPDTANEKYWEGEIVWITPDDLSENHNKYLKDSSRKITLPGLKNSPAKVIPKNSVVMSSRAPIGYLAIMLVDYTTNQGCKSFKLFQDVNTEFIYYNLIFNMRKIKRLGEGTTFDEISKTQLEKMSLDMPESLGEQQDIANILNCVDRIIDLTKQLIQKCINLKTGLIHDLFKKGVKGKPLVQTKINSEYYVIPENWDVKNIKRSILKGRIGWHGLTTKEYLIDGNYFLITGTDFKNGKVLWDTCHYVSEKRFLQDPNIRVKPNDILITKDGTIGKVAIVDILPKNATLNTGIFVLRPRNNEYLPRFMYYLLNSIFFIDFIDNLKAGSTINHLYQKDFLNFEFPLPDNVDEQVKISEILDSINLKIESEEIYLEKIIKLKEGLLHDLMSGKVRIAMRIER